MVLFTIEQPIWYMSCGSETCFMEEQQRGLVVFIYIGIELMKMQHTEGIVA